MTTNWGFLLILLFTIGVTCHPQPENELYTRVASGLSYIGCFNTSSNLQLVSSDSYNSNTWCQQQCVSVQVAGEPTTVAMSDTFECWCGQNTQLLGADELPNANCNASCAGNHTMMCGGVGLWSVYIDYSDSNANASASTTAASSATSSASTASTATSATSATLISSTSTPSASSTPSTTTIGLTVGILALLLILLIAFLSYLRFRQITLRLQAAESTTPKLSNHSDQEFEKSELHAESHDPYPRELGDGAFVEAAGTPVSEMDADPTWGKFELESPSVSVVSLGLVSPVSPMTPSPLEREGS